MALFTFGHSTLPPEEFAKLLSGRITTIIDIRSHPTSKWEHFRKEKMEEWVPAAGFNYEWWPQLGGWTAKHAPLAKKMSKHGVDLAPYMKGKFPKQRIAKTSEEEDQKSDKPKWTNVGLYDYQFFMTILEFLEGARDLALRSQSENVGIFCAEVLWWKCHRSMVCDCLHWYGVESFHVQPKFIEHSKAISNRIERYEPEVIAAWTRFKKSFHLKPITH